MMQRSLTTPHLSCPLDNATPVHQAPGGIR